MHPNDPRRSDDVPHQAAAEEADSPWPADDPLGDEGAFPSTWQQLETSEEPRGAA